MPKNTQNYLIIALISHVGNLNSGSSAFSKSRLNILLNIHILLKPGLEDFEGYFANM